MAKLYNLARMTTFTTGGGVITLAAAVSGHLTFYQVGVKDGDILSYAIVDGQALELGRGQYNISGPTLTRDVLQSTNGNLPLILTGAAEVYISEMSGGSGVSGGGGGGQGTIPLEGPGIDLVGLTIGVGLDSILVSHADGSPATEYQKNNLAGALAGAVAGDVVLLCPGTFEGDLTIPAGIGVVGLAREKHIFTGTVTLSPGASLVNVSVLPSVSSASVLAGVLGPVSGEAHLYDCIVAPANTGTGGVRAVDISNDGIIYCHNCLLDGRNVAVGAVGYAGYLAPLAIGSLFVIDGCMALGSDPDNPFNE